MIRIRKDREYYIKQGPLKVSVKIGGGHPGSIKVELKGETKIFIPAPAEDLTKLNLGSKGEILSDKPNPELYFRIKVNRLSPRPTSFVKITIHEEDDEQEIELSDPFEDTEGVIHDSIKYEVYYDLEEASIQGVG